MYIAFVYIPVITKDANTSQNNFDIKPDIPCICNFHIFGG